jgi:hypothetical protein
MGNPYLQCPRCMVEKSTQRGLLRHLRYPCHLDTPEGRRELAERARLDERHRSRRRTKWRVP